MGEWTHRICEDCWNERHPGRQAVKAKHADDEKCCFCGRLTASGIYVRENPSLLACAGRHD